LKLGGFNSDVLIEAGSLVEAGYPIEAQCATLWRHYCRRHNQCDKWIIWILVQAAVEKGTGYTVKVKVEACEYADKSSNEIAAKVALTTQLTIKAWPLIQDRYLTEAGGWSNSDVLIEAGGFY